MESVTPPMYKLPGHVRITSINVTTQHEEQFDCIYFFLFLVWTLFMCIVCSIFVRLLWVSTSFWCSGVLWRLVILSLFISRFLQPFFPFMQLLTSVFYLSNPPRTLPFIHFMHWNLLFSSSLFLLFALPFTFPLTHQFMHSCSHIFFRLLCSPLFSLFFFLSILQSSFHARI